MVELTIVGRRCRGRTVRLLHAGRRRGSQVPEVSEPGVCTRARTCGKPLSPEKTGSISASRPVGRQRRRRAALSGRSRRSPGRIPRRSSRAPRSRAGCPRGRSSRGRACSGCNVDEAQDRLRGPRGGADRRGPSRARAGPRRRAPPPPPCSGPSLPGSGKSRCARARARRTATPGAAPDRGRDARARGGGRAGRAPAQGLDLAHEAVPVGVDERERVLAAVPRVGGKRARGVAVEERGIPARPSPSAISISSTTSFLSRSSTSKRSGCPVQRQRAQKSGA